MHDIVRRHAPGTRAPVLRQNASALYEHNRASSFRSAAYQRGFRPRAVDEGTSPAGPQIESLPAQGTLRERRRAPWPTASRSCRQAVPESGAGRGGNKPVEARTAAGVHCTSSAEQERSVGCALRVADCERAVSPRPKPALRGKLVR